MSRWNPFGIVCAGLLTTFVSSFVHGEDKATDNAPTPRVATISFLPDDAPHSETLVLAALDRRVSFEFENVPLREFVKVLRKELRISIAVDEAAIRQDQDLPRTDTVPKDPQVTLDVSDVTLRSALDLALKPLELGAALKHEVLLITTREGAFVRRIGVYDVTDLVKNRDEDPNGLHDLGQMVVQNTGGESTGPWARIEGTGGDLTPLSTDDADLLIVSQTELVHRQIEKLLHETRTALEAEAGEPPLATTRSAVEQRLRRRLSIEFQDTNWRFAVQTIASRIGVPVQFEPTGTTDAPTIAWKAENVRASALLQRILAPRRLGWIASNTGLRIVPLEELGRQLEVRIYDVSDLLEHKTEKAEPDFTQLINALQTVEGVPAGPEKQPQGSMAGMRLQWRQVLVVRDTRERQDRIARLINQLRAAQRLLIRPRAGVGLGAG